jgi:tRNA pseudouridine55 synthase
LFYRCNDSINSTIDLKDYSTPEGNVLFVDKPLEWTSFDVVKKLKYALNIKKIGHAGTLDPLATGLLILCTGKKTKEIEGYQSQDKEYTGTLIIGQTTPSFDLETEPSQVTSYTHIQPEDVYQAAASFIGEIDQVPPIFSAIKVDGKRAYNEARKGKDIKMKSRKVRINAFDITEINLPKIQFRVSCTKGTYIRSLAHDFGQKLGVGAYLAALRRTKIGEYSVESAQTIEELTR